MRNLGRHRRRVNPVADASLSFVIVSYVNVHRRRRDGGSLLIAVISTVEPAARYTSPSGRVLSLSLFLSSREALPCIFLLVHLSFSYVRLWSGRTRDDFAYAGESSLDHYARRRSHTPIRRESCCWSSSAIDISPRDDDRSCIRYTEEKTLSLSLFLFPSLSLSDRIPVYAGATNYSYNLACLITRARVFTQS